jgi:hypothetical protein
MPATQTAARFVVTASTPTMLNGTFGAHRVFGSEEAVTDIAAAAAVHARRPAVVTMAVYECIGINGGGKPMMGQQVATLARMADGTFSVAWGIEVAGLPHLTAHLAA